MLRQLAIVVSVLFMLSGCRPGPSHNGSAGGIILQGFQKTNDIVGNLVMTSGDKLYIGWSGVNSADFMTATSANVYVSSWDGMSLSPLGGIVGTIPQSFMYFISGADLLSLGIYNNSPVVAMNEITGVTVDQWTGSNWEVIGNLTLADISDSVAAISSITTTASTLYFAYGEKLTTGSTIINVVSYDGSVWHPITSPATIPPGSFLISLDIAMLNNEPVVVWMQGNDATGKLTIPVSAWSRTQWVSLSNNLKMFNSPLLMAMGAPSCSITSIPAGIAVMWNEGRPFTDPDLGLLYMPTGIVATFTGTQWTSLDDAVNSNYPGIATDSQDAEQLRGLYINNTMYVAFTEMDQVFLAYYNGTGFSYVGNSLNAHQWFSGGYMASSPTLAGWKGNLYLGFFEFAVNQNTNTIISNPVIREITP